MNEIEQLMVEPPSKFTAFLVRHPELRSALRVAVYTFLASFSLGLLGFLADVSEWASGDSMTFPSVTPLGKAAAAGVVSSLSGLIAFVYNKLPRTTTARYEEEVVLTREPAEPLVEP